MTDRFILPFEPVASKTLATSTVTANTTLTMRAGSARVVALSNPSSTELIFVEFGGTSVAATATTSMVVLPGEKVRLTVPPTATRIAAIASSGTPNLYITEGTGN